ncbi:hypothetical protein Gpo141_00009840 [Globisporangium polare]
MQSSTSTAGGHETSWKTTVERAFCLPVMLVANFVIALYFRAIYVSTTKRSRRTDSSTLVLHLSAFVSFASLVPFASQGDRVLRHLNDISEACLVLAFSSQIVIITSDASRRCNLRSLRYFTRTAEFFCGLAIVVVALSTAMIFDEHLAMLLEHVIEWHESLALVFIVAFRFYYITLSRGSVLTLLRQQPLETFAHALLVTHAYPFVIAKSCTGVALDFFKGFYLRALVLLCAWVTARDKKCDEGKRQQQHRGKTNNNNRSVGPIVQPKLSSIVPQASTGTTNTRRGSTRPSLMTMYSFKRVYQRRHPNVIFPEQLSTAFPAGASGGGSRSRAASSVKSRSST